jgi:hypothetical protein
MSNPKYPDIKVSTHHRSTDPVAVLRVVLQGLESNGVTTTEVNQYLDNVLALIHGKETNAQRAVAVVEESRKWVTLSD